VCKRKRCIPITQLTRVHLIFSSAIVTLPLFTEDCFRSLNITASPPTRLFVFLHFVALSPLASADPSLSTPRKLSAMAYPTGKIPWTKSLSGNGSGSGNQSVDHTDDELGERMDSDPAASSSPDHGSASGEHTDEHFIGPLPEGTERLTSSLPSHGSGLSALPSSSSDHQPDGRNKNALPERTDSLADSGGPRKIGTDLSNMTEDERMKWAWEVSDPNRKPKSKPVRPDPNSHYVSAEGKVAASNSSQDILLTYY